MGIILTPSKLNRNRIKDSTGIKKNEGLLVDVCPAEGAIERCKWSLSADWLSAGDPGGLFNEPKHLNCSISKLTTRWEEAEDPADQTYKSTMCDKTKHTHSWKSPWQRLYKNYV